MPSNLPKHFIYLLLIGFVTITSLLFLPTLVPLDGETGSDWLVFFGRFHIVVLHLPIGWLTLVPLLEFFSKRYQLPEFTKAIHITLCVAAVSAITAVIFGITLASSEGYSGQTVTNHMWLGITTSIAIILACLLNQARHIFKQKILTVSYVFCLLVSLSAVTVGGHLGGALVQGEGYLTEKLPADLKITLGFEEPEVLVTLGSPIYEGFIEPVLAQRCMNCHSEQKVKGKFRMDSIESLFKGGKSKKAAIVPSDVSASELIHRITLPVDDDHAMPPDGRTPLNEEQVSLIRWWVEIGAPIDDGINTLPADKLTPEIEYIMEAVVAASRERLFPTKAYSSIDIDVLIEHIAILKSEYGIDITPLSQDPKDGLHISSFNRLRTLDSQAWQALQPLASFIYSADLGQMELSQESIDGIATFSQLEELMLDGTSLSGVSLSGLSTLSNLKVLNLFDTAVDDTSVKTLVNIRSLKKLYIAKTNIRQPGLDELKASLRRTTIFHDIEVVEDQSTSG